MRFKVMSYFMAIAGCIGLWVTFILLLV